MGKSLRTITMTNAIKQYFQNIGILLEEEVMCNEGQKKCDLAGLDFHDNKAYCSIGIEIKQAKSDMNTGCGMNFTFDVNYLCVPFVFNINGKSIIFAL